MSKYQNGKVYKIVDVGYNKCYIGSTTESLSQRLARHKHHYNEHKIGKRRHMRSFDLFDEFGFDNCKIELIEFFSSNSREELRKREGHHIRDEDCVNKAIAGRSKQEWARDNYEKNRDSLLEKAHKYRQEHKEHMLQNCKKWREENKEKKAESDKQYREKNWEIIKQRQCAKTNCVCGGKYTYQNKARHERTKRHHQYVESLNEH